MVSVIIPNYNHAPYLKKRIDSILSQTYQDFELIILDDESTDNSCDIIETYRTHSKVSHIIYSQKNSGSTFKQWNKGISLAKGKYIWIAESDDVADPKLLEVLMSHLKCNPKCVIAYTDLYEIDSENKIIGDWRYTYPNKIDVCLFSTSFFMNGTEYIEKYISIENTIPNASAVVFSKEMFYKVGGADEDIKYCADWLLWLKLLAEGDVFYSQEKLNYFRTHSSSVIASVWNNPKNVFLKKYTIIMWKRFFDYLNSSKSVDGNLYNVSRNTIATDSMIEFFFLIRRNQYKRALTYLGKANSFATDPLFILKYIYHKLF